MGHVHGTALQLLDCLFDPVFEWLQFAGYKGIARRIAFEEGIDEGVPAEALLLERRDLPVRFTPKDQPPAKPRPNITSASTAGPAYFFCFRTMS